MRRSTLKEILCIGCCSTLVSGSLAPTFAQAAVVRLSGVTASVPRASVVSAFNPGIRVLAGWAPTFAAASPLIAAPTVLPGALAAPISLVPAVLQAAAPAAESAMLVPEMKPADALGAVKDLSDRLAPSPDGTPGGDETAAVSSRFFDQFAQAGAGEAVPTDSDGGGSSHGAGNDQKGNSRISDLADLIKRVRDPEVKELLLTMKTRGDWLDDEIVPGGKVLHHERSADNSEGGLSSWVADLSWAPVRGFTGLRVLREENTVKVPGVVWDYHAAVYYADAEGVLQSAGHERRASKYIEELHPLPTDTPEARREFSSLVDRLYKIFSASGFADLIKKMGPHGALNHLERRGGKISGEQLRLKKTREGVQFLEVSVGDSEVTNAPGRHTQEDQNRIYTVSMSGQQLSVLDKKAARILEDSQDDIPPGPERDSGFRELLRYLTK